MCQSLIIPIGPDFGSEPTLRGRVYYYLYIQTFYVDIIVDSYVVINNTEVSALIQSRYRTSPIIIKILYVVLS